MNSIFWKKQPGKSVEKKKTQKIPDYYIIKSDGSVKLDLAKAAKSEHFKAGIRRIRQSKLMQTG